jgi:hypothetical protein
MALSITPRLFNSTDIGFGKAAVLEEIQVRVCRQFRVGNSVDKSDWTPAYGVPAAAGIKKPQASWRSAH